MNNKKYFMMLIALMGIAHSVQSDWKSYGTQGAKKAGRILWDEVAQPVVTDYAGQDVANAASGAVQKITE